MSCWYCVAVFLVVSNTWAIHFVSGSLPSCHHFQQTSLPRSDFYWREEGTQTANRVLQRMTRSVAFGPILQWYPKDLHESIFLSMHQSTMILPSFATNWGVLHVLLLLLIIHDWYYSNQVGSVSRF
jgi:hypothetical protein